MTVVVKRRTINIQEWISTIPAASVWRKAADTVGLSGVFSVPLGAGKAAGVGDVFGGAAVLAAEVLIGVYRVPRHPPTECRIKPSCTHVIKTGVRVEVIPQPTHVAEGVGCAAAGLNHVPKGFVQVDVRDRLGPVRQPVGGAQSVEVVIVRRA